MKPKNTMNHLTTEQVAILAQSIVSRLSAVPSNTDSAGLHFIIPFKHMLKEKFNINSQVLLGFYPKNYNPPKEEVENPVDIEAYREIILDFTTFGTIPDDDFIAATDAYLLVDNILFNAMGVVSGITYISDFYPLKDNYLEKALELIEIGGYYDPFLTSEMQTAIDNIAEDLSKPFLGIGKYDLENPILTTLTKVLEQNIPMEVAIVIAKSIDEAKAANLSAEEFIEGLQNKKIGDKTIRVVSSKDK